MFYLFIYLIKCTFSLFYFEKLTHFNFQTYYHLVLKAFQFSLFKSWALSQYIYGVSEAFILEMSTIFLKVGLPKRADCGFKLFGKWLKLISCCHRPVNVATMVLNTLVFLAWLHGKIKRNQPRNPSKYVHLSTLGSSRLSFRGTNTPSFRRNSKILIPVARFYLNK